MAESPKEKNIFTKKYYPFNEDKFYSDTESKQWYQELKAFDEEGELCWYDKVFKPVAVVLEVLASTRSGQVDPLMYFKRRPRKLMTVLKARTYALGLVFFPILVFAGGIGIIALILWITLLLR